MDQELSRRRVRLSRFARQTFLMGPRELLAFSLATQGYDEARPVASKDAARERRTGASIVKAPTLLVNGEDALGRLRARRRKRSHGRREDADVIGDVDVLGDDATQFAELDAW
jgi:hypothetical protein